MSSNTKHMGSPIGSRMIINGREVDYYCGTSYYALHGHPLMIQAACDVRKYGLRAATGASVPAIEEVSEQACDFFDAEAATYVVSGYLGAMILVQALREDYDVVLVDESSHYSVFDGLRASNTTVVRFRHLDPENLKRKLAAHVRPGQSPLVMTDGVFPTTGSIAPLPAHASVLSHYTRGLLCIDESHGVGVIGRRGRGTFDYFEMEGDGLHFTGTLSKAFGSIGGIIPGDRSLTEKIRRNARILVGASPPPRARGGGDDGNPYPEGASRDARGPVAQRLHPEAGTAVAGVQHPAFARPHCQHLRTYDGRPETRPRGARSRERRYSVRSPERVLGCSGRRVAADRRFFHPLHGAAQLLGRRDRARGIACLSCQSPTLRFNLQGDFECDSDARDPAPVVHLEE